MKSKVFVALAVAVLVFSFLPVLSMDSPKVDVVNADSGLASFGVQEKVSSYSISSDQTSEWYYLKIDQGDKTQ